MYIESVLVVAHKGSGEAAELNTHSLMMCISKGQLR